MCVCECVCMCVCVCVSRSQLSMSRRCHQWRGILILYPHSHILTGYDYSQMLATSRLNPIRRSDGHKVFRTRKSGPWVPLRCVTLPQTQQHWIHSHSRLIIARSGWAEAAVSCIMGAPLPFFLLYFWGAGVGLPFSEDAMVCWLGSR